MASQRRRGMAHMAASFDSGNGRGDSTRLSASSTALVPAVEARFNSRQIRSSGSVEDWYLGFVVCGVASGFLVGVEPGGWDPFGYLIFGVHVDGPAGLLEVSVVVAAE